MAGTNRGCSRSTQCDLFGSCVTLTGLKMNVLSHEPRPPIAKSEINEFCDLSLKFLPPNGCYPFNGEVPQSAREPL